MTPARTGCDAMSDPNVYDALFGPLPADWRARKGLPAAETPTPATAKPTTKPSDAASPPRLPGAPDSPWDLSRASWIEIAKRTVKEFSKDRVTSVAGGVTFFGLLALFPAITALVSIYGLLADPQTILRHMEGLNRFLPQGAVDVIAGQVQSIVNAPTTALSAAGAISILLALYSANGGMKALIEALNVAWFETEKRGFIKLNLVSMAFTLGGIVVILLLIGLVAVLPVALSLLAFGSGMETLVSLARWPVMIAVLMLCLSAIYRWGPSKDDAAWHWISPGAIVAALGLVTASVLFSWYASNFANYNETYGSLGAAVGLMMWLWIAAIVIMTGAEINSEVERQIRIENGVEEQGHAEEESSDPKKKT